MPFSEGTLRSLECSLHSHSACEELAAEVANGLWVPNELAFTDVSGAATVVQLPTTGLVINQHRSVITTATDGATVTFNCATSDWHKVVLADDRILALSNVSAGQEITLILTQGGTGTNAVTWFAGILWAGGAAPTLTTDVGQSDIFKFKQIATDTYLGWVVAQDL